MFGLHIGQIGVIQRAVSIYAQSLAQLRSRGDTLWMPGVGIVNGLTPGNYVESIGPTVAAVDGLAGLAIDAQSTPQSALTLSAWVGVAMTLSVVSGWQRGTSTSNPAYIYASFPSITGTTYRISARIRASAGTWRFLIGTSSTGSQIYTGSANTDINIFVTAQSGTTYITARSLTMTIGDYVEVTDVVVAPVPGIHLTQATTANKPFLRQTGAILRWEFDTTDTLAATIPAGYESATVIDAAPTGQVTLTGQNIVGTYSIGPSITTHGRIVARNALTAPELALYQQLANKLAGL